MQTYNLPPWDKSYFCNSSAIFTNEMCVSSVMLSRYTLINSLSAMHLYYHIVLYVYVCECVYLRSWWSRGRFLLLFPSHWCLRGCGRMNWRGGVVSGDDGSFATSSCFDQQTLLLLSEAKKQIKINTIYKQFQVKLSID